MLLVLFYSVVAAQQTLFTYVSNSPVHRTLTGFMRSSAEITNIVATPGPHTFFAPTDAAFAKLAPAVMQALRTNPALLVQLLKYHIVTGMSFPNTTPRPRSFARTTLGPLLRLDVDYRNNVRASFGVGSAGVLASVPTANGIVHVADTVLIPPTVASKTLQALRYSEFVAAIANAGLQTSIDALADVTVFVPNNQAFAKLRALASQRGVALTTVVLSAAITCHILPRMVTMSELLAAPGPYTMRTVQGYDITVRLVAGNIYISGQGNRTPVRIVSSDILMHGGIMHEIDGVLLPNLNAIVPLASPYRVLCPTAIGSYPLRLPILCNYAVAAPVPDIFLPLRPILSAAMFPVAQYNPVPVVTIAQTRQQPLLISQVPITASVPIIASASLPYGSTPILSSVPYGSPPIIASAPYRSPPIISTGAIPYGSPPILSSVPYGSPPIIGAIPCDETLIGGPQLIGSSPLAGPQIIGSSPFGTSTTQFQSSPAFNAASTLLPLPMNGPASTLVPLAGGIGGIQVNTGGYAGQGSVGGILYSSATACALESVAAILAAAAGFTLLL